MEVREYAIDCRKMTSRAEAHDHLAEVFGFPEYYGRNLDALHDCLTELPPCRIRLEYPWALGKLGRYSVSLLQVFSDAAGENGGIELI